jgi:hypothetical protein
MAEEKPESFTASCGLARMVAFHNHSDLADPFNVDQEGSLLVLSSKCVFEVKYCGRNITTDPKFNNSCSIEIYPRTTISHCGPV